MGIKRTGVIAAATASVVVGSSLAFPGAALAGPSVNVTGTIALDSSTLRAADTGLKYGDSAKFRTTVEGRLAAKAYVYVTVVCVQGSDVVYRWSGTPDFEFPLVDQTGEGLDWDGTAADCSSALIYRIDGQKPTVETLARTTFAVNGSVTA